MFALCVLLFAGWVWNTNRRGEAALEEILAELDRRGLPTDTYYLKKEFGASVNGKNAARFYEAAFAALGEDEAYEMSVPCVGSADMPELGEPIDRERQVKMATFLDEQRAFFSLLATARKHRRCFYNLDFNTRESQASAFLGDARQAARTLCVKSLHEQALGRPEGALDACEAIVDINLSLRNQPWCAVKLFQASNGRYLCKSIEQTLSRTTPSIESLRALRSKLLLESESTSITEMIKAEIAYVAMQLKHPHFSMASAVHRNEQMAVVAQDFPGRCRWQAFMDRPDARMMVSPDRMWPLRLLSAWVSVCPGAYRLDMMDEAKFFLREYDALPAPSHDRAARATQRLRGVTAESDDTAKIAASWARWDLECIQYQARLVAAATALSAEVCRIENGKWPNALSELQDEKLLDPFSGKPLKYRQMDGDCIVYSIGMNQRDDGGVEDKSYTAEDRKDDIVFRLFAVEKRNVKPKAEECKRDGPEN
ncbi:MAG: hypothetical protein ABIF82_15035 [Planctomycetota bacterium]